MKIKADQNLRLFSHTPGTALLLPGTLIAVTVFSTKLEFRHLDQPELLLEMDLELEGEVKNFTVFQDLEKRLIEIQGFSKTGFFRYRLLEDGQEKKIIKFYLLKAPKKALTFKFKKIKAESQTKAKTNARIKEEGKQQKVRTKKSTVLPLKLEAIQSKTIQNIEPSGFELLSLGMHKKLDFELLKRRTDLRELLPLWFRLGQITPLRPFIATGALHLLKDLEKAVQENQKNEVKMLLSRIFKTGFKGLFLPRLFDDQHQGIVTHKSDQAVDKKASSLSASSLLLSYGAKLIRALFFQEEKKLWKILPVSFFFAGRFINLKTELGLLHIEWTKKLLKKMILKANKSGQIKLQLQRELSTFRLRASLKEKGRILNKSQTVFVEKGQHYLFDRFQK